MRVRFVLDRPPRPRRASRRTWPAARARPATRVTRAVPPPSPTTVPPSPPGPARSAEPPGTASSGPPAAAAAPPSAAVRSAPPPARRRAPTTACPNRRSIRRIFLLYLGGESGPGHPFDRRTIEPRQDQSQGRLRVYLHLIVLAVTSCPACTDGLDGDLARLQQWPRREDGPFAHTRRVAALSWRGELPGVCASAAAAVGFRAKASGRREVRRVPCGRIAPAFAVVLAFPP